MTDDLQQENKRSYRCPECGLHYEDKGLAERCEAWCRKHKSCNLEITAQSVEERYGRTSQ